MASTYSPLKIELITTGEQSGTWGSTTNVNLGTAIEEAITGSADVTFASANVTLTLTDTNGSQTARNLRLRLTGTTGGARDLIVPAIEKQYIVLNECADAITVKNATGTGVSVPPSLSAILYNDGTNITCASVYSTTIVTPVLAATDAVFINALPVTSGGTGVTTSTGTGNVVLSTSPTLVTPALGTPSALVGTNITGTAAGLSIGGNLTGASPTAATQASGTNNTTVATTAFVRTALQILYPVGCIYTTTVSTNPNTLFGFGTWVAFGAGRVMIGNGGGFSAGATGGSADAVVVSHTHTATVTDGGHAHNYVKTTRQSASGPLENGGEWDAVQSTVASSSATTGISVSNSTTGVSGTNANLQPYVVVYMWNRTV